MSLLPLAFTLIKTHMSTDPDYLWTWQCNIAMPIKDSVGCSHEQANRAAASILSNLFCVDVTEMEQWKEFERAWENTRNRENVMRGTSKEDAEAKEIPGVKDPYQDFASKIREGMKTQEREKNAERSRAAEALCTGYGTAKASEQDARGPGYKPQYEERKATIDVLQKNVGQFAFDRFTASEAMQQAIHWLLEQQR